MSKLKYEIQKSAFGGNTISIHYGDATSCFYDIPKEIITIIEQLEDTINKTTENIMFLDSDERFNEYDWGDEENG